MRPLDLTQQSRQDQPEPMILDSGESIMDHHEPMVFESGERTSIYLNPWP